MKKHLIISLSFGLLLRMSVLSVAYADNCYVHERGSDSWYDCKEQAGQSESVRKKNDANLRQLQAETAADSAARMQAEQTVRDLKAMIQEEKRQGANNDK